MANPPTGYQRSRNSVAIVFDEEPRKLDPSDPTDALNLDNYTVTGPFSPLPERLLQAVTYESDNTVFLWFDGELVEGEIYSILVENILSIGGSDIAQATIISFVAFNVDGPVIPLRYENAESWDIANPQVERDRRRGSLGTFGVDEEGDLEVDSRRANLRKRILRRVTTSPGGFSHLPGYGVFPGSKVLAKPGQFRRLQQDAEAQAKEEPDVITARATLTETAPGVFWLTLRVTDHYGAFNIETAIGDGQ